MAIGERIFLARKMMKMSQRALAEEVGVSAMAISKYERGENVPGSAVLARLASALKTPLEFFFRADLQPVQLHAYRKHSSLGKKDQAAIIAQVQEWLERYDEVESLFHVAPEAPVLPRFEVCKPPEIESAAAELRRRWLLGNDPLENLTQILEDQGIKVGLVDGFDRFDACTLVANAEFPVIVTRSDLPGDRQRYNLAHELGHAVLSPCGAMDEEKAAHRFAGAFIVPETVAIFELGERRTGLELQELSILKEKYGLSMQAWIYRARDLEIISHGTASRWFRYFRSNGWHKREPGKQRPVERPRRMELLVYRALAEDLISRSRASELLGGRLEEIGNIGREGVDARSVRPGD